MSSLEQVHVVSSSQCINHGKKLDWIKQVCNPTWDTEAGGLRVNGTLSQRGTKGRGLGTEDVA